MDERLQVKSSRRVAPPGMSPHQPLATIGWRALRAEAQRRAAAAELASTEARQSQAALVVMADAVYALRRLAHLAGTVAPAGQRLREPSEGAAPQAGAERGPGPFWSAGGGPALAAALDRMEQALSSLGVSVVAPEGQPYVGDLTELLENLAQQPQAGLAAPQVLEVVTPAILYRGAVLRMGKAIIAVPASAPPAPQKPAGE
jgi:hypothetical protein